mgnify:CR=1 FL=1
MSGIIRKVVKTNVLSNGHSAKHYVVTVLEFLKQQYPWHPLPIICETFHGIQMKGMWYPLGRQMSRVETFPSHGCMIIQSNDFLSWRENPIAHSGMVTHSPNKRSREWKKGGELMDILEVEWKHIKWSVNSTPRLKHVNSTHDPWSYYNSLVVTPLIGGHGGFGSDEGIVDGIGLFPRGFISSGETHTFT